MSNEQKLYKVKTFQLQSMLNAIGCINQRFAFKNSRISCLALIFNLKNPSTTVLYAKNQLQVAKYDEWYTIFFEPSIRSNGEWYTVFFEPWIRTNGSVVKTGCRESTLVRWMLKPSAAPRLFWVAVSPSVHWHACFLYCCAPYDFFFLDFVSGDLALTEL